MGHLFCLFFFFPKKTQVKQNNKTNRPKSHQGAKKKQRNSEKPHPQAWDWDGHDGLGGRTTRKTRCSSPVDSSTTHEDPWRICPGGENRRPIANLVTTSKAPVTTSVALVTTSVALVSSSFLLLLVRHLLLLAWHLLLLANLNQMVFRSKAPFESRPIAPFVVRPGTPFVAS